MPFQLADTTRTPARKALPRAPRFSTVTTTDNSAGAGKGNVLKTWQYVAPKTETLAYDEDSNLRADARWKLIWDAEPSRGIGGEIDAARRSRVRARAERPHGKRVSVQMADKGWPARPGIIITQPRCPGTRHTSLRLARSRP